MTQAQKKPANPFKSLWGKGDNVAKLNSKASLAIKPVSKPVESADELALRFYSGPAHLVAANLLYGLDRLWPVDAAAEKSLPWQAAEGECIGVLGAGLGAYAANVAKQVPTASVYEFDWRADVARWRIERMAGESDGLPVPAATNSTFYELNSGGLLPPPSQCGCILSVEPVFAQNGDSLLRWARMALEYAGTFILEEICTDTVAAPSIEKKRSWMARDDSKGQWLNLEEQKAILRRNGFHLGKIRERTGAQLRSLRECLDTAEERMGDLQEAIKRAPSLQSVADHFNCEQKAAKNRLKALEHGALAVYRMEVIKPRADELI